VIHQAQDVAGLVEICVSDNASRDGTAQSLARLSQHPHCPVLYRRQPEDTGLARNLLAAVGLARGRYCWLLGSDDLLAPGALRRACELLDELPDATGYVVGAMHVDAEHPGLRSRALPRAFHPRGQTQSIEGFDRILDSCGNAWCALSWTVVDREAWLRAAQRRAEMVLAHPVFPQIVVLAGMAEERPLWGWLAEPLVHQRNATTFLFEEGDLPLAARWTQIIAGAAAVWGAVLGRGGIRWRRRMRRLNEVWGSAADARATKLYGSPPSLRSQARLASACLGAFWPVRSYWREVLPATLMPAWLTRARYGFQHANDVRGRAIETARLAISGFLPARMVAGSVEAVQIEARNDGRRTILPEGPRGVTIGQRWLTDARRPLGREELGLNELAALPQPVPRALRAGRGTHLELTLYAPIEPGLYRVEAAAHQHGRGWLDELGELEVLAADIDVFDPSARAAQPGGTAKRDPRSADA
jgi:hypothetical protein